MCKLGEPLRILLYLASNLEAIQSKHFEDSIIQLTNCMRTMPLHSLANCWYNAMPSAQAYNQCACVHRAFSCNNKTYMYNLYVCRAMQIGFFHPYRGYNQSEGFVLHFDTAILVYVVQKVYSYILYMQLYVYSKCVTETAATIPYHCTLYVQAANALAMQF